MIVLFAFGATMLYAGGMKINTIKPESYYVETTIDVEKLAPATPAYAEFTDGTEFKASPVTLVRNLAPVTPKEADFDDASLPVKVTTAQLAPASPKEPDFEETDFAVVVTPCTLAPATPSEADFTK